MKKDRTIGGEAVSIVVLDTFVALMAGFIIIPACFSFGVQPDAGPSLLLRHCRMCLTAWLVEEYGEQHSLYLCRLRRFQRL